MERTITIVEDLSWDILPDVGLKCLEGGRLRDSDFSMRAYGTIPSSERSGITALDRSDASDSQMRREESPRFNGSLGAQGYAPVPEAEDLELRHDEILEVPPPYLPSRPSFQDSDSEAYEIAHP